MADRRPASPPPAATTAAAPSDAPTAAPEAPTSEADETTPVMPAVADGISVRWLDAAAPWAGQVGAVPTSTRFAAAVVASVDLLFDDTKAALRHTETFEGVVFPLADPPDVSALTAVDHDARDLLTAAPAGATYELPDASVKTKALFTHLQKGIVDHLLVQRTITLFTNPELKLYSRPGETQEEFVARCDAAADVGADAATAVMAKKYQARIERARAAVATAQDRVTQAQAAQSTKKTDELMTGAGDLLGAVFGGRGSARSIARQGRWDGVTAQPNERGRPPRRRRRQPGAGEGRGPGRPRSRHGRRADRHRR